MTIQRAKVVMWTGVAFVAAGCLWWISLHNTGAERAGDCSLRELSRSLDEYGGRQPASVPLVCESAPSTMPAILVLIAGLAVVVYAVVSIRGSRSEG